MFKKSVVFSLISMGNKYKIIITQEDSSGREIVKVEFMGEKIKKQIEKFGEKWGGKVWRELGGKLGKS